MAASVEFHTGVADKLGYACRLLRKAQQRGARVVVTGSAETLRELDQRLWTFEALAFVPHAVLRAGERPAARLARTPIWIVAPGAEPPHREVVLHLGAEALPYAAACTRLIDIVADDDRDRAAGRARWRAYAAQGCAIQHHERGGAA